MADQEVDGQEEVDGQGDVPASGTLLHQSDIDAAKNRSSVHRTGEIADSDGDGVPDYRDEAANEYGTDSDGDNDDADGDGVDDDDENDEDWVSDVDNDDSGFYSSDNDYCNMDRYGSRFNQDYQNAVPADKAAVDITKQAVVTAGQAPRTADNFLALKQAEINANIASTTLVVNAGGPDAAAAAARLRGLKGANTSLQKFETSLEGKTDAEKAATLQEKFPKQWQPYSDGKPTETGPRSGASYSAQNDLPGAGIRPPSSQSLSSYFGQMASQYTPAVPTIAPAPTVRAPAQALTA